MEKEKNILKAIANLVTGSNHETELPIEAEAKHAAIEVNASVALPNGKYTTEDGTSFTIADGVITEVTLPKEEEPVTEQPQESMAVESDNKYETQFSAINEKLNSFLEFDKQLKALEEKINTIGNQPAAAPIQRTESMSEQNNTVDFRKYFKTEKDYKSYMNSIK